MLRPLTTLLLCQFVGEVVAHALDLPLPGPVIGLLVLLGVLVVRHGPDDAMRSASNGLLRHLSLLFVPAGVGVMTQLDALAQDWVAIAGAVLVSTALGLVVTGLVMQSLSR